MAIIANFIFVSVMIDCMVQFNVHAQPEIIVHPKDTNVIRGETATLYCTIANQLDDPFWTKNGKTFAMKPADSQNDRDQKRWDIFGDDSRGEFNLQIINVDDSDAGLYACNVTVSEGASSGESSAVLFSSSPAALHVLPPPDGDFPECLISIEGSLDIGEAVELTCAYKNLTSKTELLWTKRDDDNFSPLSLETHVRDGFIVSQFYHSITRRDHLSIFQCVAQSQDLRSPLSCTTGFVLVRHAPDVVVNPMSPEAERGDRVEITCEIASSYPIAFNYTWRYKGQTLDKFGNKIAVSGMQISIGDLDSSDKGADVTCEAVNAIGSNRATATIEVRGPPDVRILSWVISIVIISIIIVAVLVLAGLCRCKTYARNQKLKANGWTAEQFVMDTHLQPECRNSDATTDFFLTRTITTPERQVSMGIRQQSLPPAGRPYLQETAIDSPDTFQGHERSEYQMRPQTHRRDYGSMGTDRRNSGKNIGDQPQNRSGIKHSQRAYAELDLSSSPKSNTSPEFSDSGLDYQLSSIDESRSPTPGFNGTYYAQVRRGRTPRVGSRLSVRERQAIMDEL